MNPAPPVIKTLPFIRELSSLSSDGAVSRDSLFSVPGISNARAYSQAPESGFFVRSGELWRRLEIPIREKSM